MTIFAQLDPSLGLVRFDQFPQIPLIYQVQIYENNPAFVPLEVTDKKTQAVVQIFIEKAVLLETEIPIMKWRAGQIQFNTQLRMSHRKSSLECLLQRVIPIASKHLAPKYLAFFTDTTNAINVISKFIETGMKHQSATEAIPGFYLSSSGSAGHILINLKKAKPLGSGTFGNVKPSLWLTAPQPSKVLIAKKVLKDPWSNPQNFLNEIEALSEFSGAPGIVPLLFGGDYNDKLAAFMPSYDCSFNGHKELFPISLDDMLEIVSQLLQGIAKISDKGIHGDLSFSNILLMRRDEQGKFKAGIADFGAFRVYGNEAYGLCTPSFAPPEYHREKAVTSKQDVWALGIAFLQLFCKSWLPFSRCEKHLLVPWLLTLQPGWISKCPRYIEPPTFLLELINDMLNPNPEQRPSAKEALARFLEGHAAYLILEPRGQYF